MTALTLENQLFAAAIALPNIINREFDARSLRCLVAEDQQPFAVDCGILFCNSPCKDIQQRSPLCLVFYINEPVMYGLPIVLNPIIIPLIFTPVVNVLIAWFTMSRLGASCNGIYAWKYPPL